ncbi:MAG: ribose-phosphate diphosphokinase [Candidatus Saganbacteria bacterium]|nr:ribose-phosphate diphosphokinase [Candidatus Saganbacteria bacterium]
MFVSGSQLKEVAKIAGAWALEVAGHNVRLASNRLTTITLRAAYSAWREKSAPTLARMLKEQPPLHFKDVSYTTFIAGSDCQEETEAFTRRNHYRTTGAEIKRFRNGEIYARVGESVRGQNVVIVQDFSKGDINEKLMETLLLIDAAKRASARKVELLCPQLPYIEEKPGTGDYEADFFKLMLNLLFNAAGLDVLKVGDISLDKATSLLLLQGKIFSQAIAPYLFAKACSLDKETLETHLPIVYFIGENFKAIGKEIVSKMFRNGIMSHSAGLVVSRDAKTGAINMDLGKESCVKGKKAYVFQTCNTGSVNRDLVELLLMIYTAKKRGAKEVVAVIPYLPYNRQERKAKVREAIAAKLVANMLVTAGATQIVSLDLHAAATQGFVDIPFQHITAFKAIADTIKDLIRGASGWFKNDPVVGAADAGRLKSARWMGLEVFGPKADFVAVSKERPRAGEALALAIAGRFADRDVIIFDDMVDSGGTIIGAARPLKNGWTKEDVYNEALRNFRITVALSPNTPAVREMLTGIVGFLAARGKAPEEGVVEKAEEITLSLGVLFDYISSFYDTTIRIDNSMEAGKAKGVYVAMTHGVFSDVKLYWENKDKAKDAEAKEEFEDLKVFFKKQGKKLEDYVKVEEDGFTVNALIRFQASRYIDGIIFTDSINVPAENIIAKEKIKVISTAELLAGVCTRIIQGDSLEDHEYEGAAKK